jgi:hypothetical protein
VSLFKKLLQLHSKYPGIVPEEDFFTEIVAHLFMACPDLLHRWVTSLNFFDLTDAVSMQVVPQPSFDPLTGHAIGSRPDVLIKVENGEESDWIFLESKLGSVEGTDQLQRYAEILHSRDKVRHKALLYVTKHYDPKDQSEIFRNISETSVQFKQLRWQDFYCFLSRQPGNPLSDEVLAFMRETRMDQSNQFTSSELLALSNMPNVLRIMNEILQGEVRDRFEKVVGTVDRNPKTVLRMLVDNRVYYHYRWFPEKFWCGVGFALPLDEYPIVKLLVEVAPTSGERPVIVNAMREIVASRPIWQPTNLDRSDQWTHISIKRSLRDFLPFEDQVSAIKEHLIKSIDELEAIISLYPHLPWRDPATAAIAANDY